MNRTSKSFAAFIILTVAISTLSLLMVKPATAQSMAKPPIPHFSLKFVDASHDVPPSYSTNPYTGENITHAGYHVDNRTIQITIVNSNFALSSGRLCFLYYTVQIKGHNVQNWTNLFPYIPNSPSGLLPQSNTDYTVISESVQSLPTNVQLDLRVQCLLVNQTIGFEIIGTSDWSNTQTITIPEGSVSTSPNPTSTSTQNPTPTVPEFSSWVIPLLLTLMLAVAGLLVYRKKHKDN